MIRLPSAGPAVLLASLAACTPAAEKGGEGTDPTGPQTTAPGATWPDACADPGPDAPVENRRTPTVEVFEGFDAVYWVPEHPRGLYVYFMGGDGPDEVLQHEQVATIWNLMGDEGFGVVATDRTDPDRGANWDLYAPFADNDDARRVARLLDHVRDAEGLPDDLPLVMTGFSDGSGMAVTMGRIAWEEGWPILAVTAHNGAYGEPGPVPTLYLVAENDPVPGVDARVDDLLAEGIAAERLDHPERLVAPAVFQRVPQIAADDAEALVAELRDLEAIDASGARLVPDAELEQALTLWGRRSDARGIAVAEPRLRVVWATHRYNAFHAADECRFVLDALAAR